MFRQQGHFTNADRSKSDKRFQMEPLDLTMPEQRPSGSFDLKGPQLNGMNET